MRLAFAIKFLSALLLPSILALPATAQTYPSRPVKIIVPVGTGGTTDVLARHIAGKLQAMWGEGVVIEDKPGAAGNIGTDLVVRSPADGYTLLVQNSAMVINKAIGVKATFDYEKDLTPITMLGQSPLILLAHPSTHIHTLADLVARAKADPKALSYGSCAVGGPHHMFMERLKQQAGIEVTHVAYKSCAAALNDLLGDHVPIAVVGASQAIAYVKDKKLNAIGISSARRYAPLPDVATIEEQGLKPMDMTSWYALFGPAGLPAPVVAKLQKDVATALDDKAIKDALSAAGVEVVEGGSTDVTRLIKSEAARYQAIAKAANIKAQ